MHSQSIDRCICFVEINKNNCDKTIWQNSQMLRHANLGKFKTIKGSNYCLWIYCSIHVIWIIVSIIHSNKQQKFHALWMTLGTLKLNIALCGNTTSWRFLCVWGFGSNNDCQNIRKLRQSFADFRTAARSFLTASLRLPLSSSSLNASCCCCSCRDKDKTLIFKF